jgi:Ca2+-dependent lipid-binding protein
MAHGKILRNLFSHGSRHSKSKTSAKSLQVSDPETHAAVTKPSEPIANPTSGATKALPAPPNAPKTPERNSHIVDVLPEILEEANPETDAQTPDSPSISDSPSITVTDTDAPTSTTSAITILPPRITPAVLDPTTFTTRDLLYAALDEATAATNTHLDTIETTLALLQALNGFSTTVDVLKREMQDKKRVCEEKLGELECLEEAVEGMVFADEGYDVDGEMGEVERERESARRALEGGV